eukprot:Sspe_Gene.76896::Locus_48031_Transcript_1_1_Confidence_1.000_Length_420::g.76896::m.76896
MPRASGCLRSPLLPKQKRCHPAVVSAAVGGCAAAILVAAVDRWCRTMFRTARGETVFVLRDSMQRGDQLISTAFGDVDQPIERQKCRATSPVHVTHVIDALKDRYGVAALLSNRTVSILFRDDSAMV